MDFLEGALLTLLGYGIARLLYTMYRLVPKSAEGSD
jgi:hypothetical protein